jgi:hypothetical protein
MLRLVALLGAILMRPAARLFDGRLSALRQRWARWAREDQRERDRDPGRGQGSRR